MRGAKKPVQAVSQRIGTALQSCGGAGRRAHAQALVRAPAAWCTGEERTRWLARGLQSSLLPPAGPLQPLRQLRPSPPAHPAPRGRYSAADRLPQRSRRGAGRALGRIGARGRAQQGLGARHVVGGGGRQPLWAAACRAECLTRCAAPRPAWPTASGPGRAQAPHCPAGGACTAGGVSRSHVRAHVHGPRRCARRRGAPEPRHVASKARSACSRPSASSRPPRRASRSRIWASLRLTSARTCAGVCEAQCASLAHGGGLGPACQLRWERL